MLHKYKNDQYDVKSDQTGDYNVGNIDSYIEFTVFI